MTHSVSPRQAAPRSQLPAPRLEAELTAAEHAVRFFHALAVDTAQPFDTLLQRVLAFGTVQLGLEAGLLANVDDDSYVVEATNAPEGFPLHPGDELSPPPPCARLALERRRPAGFHDAGEALSGEPDAALPLRASVAAPVLVEGRPYGVLEFASREPRAAFSSTDVDCLALMAAWVGSQLERRQLVEELHERNQQLASLASTDWLTGLPNRRGVEERALAEVSRAARTAEPLSVVLFDIDHFKRINDQFGHPSGDAALRQIAGMLSMLLRAYDIVGRWGGEEFLVVLPGTGPTDAVAVAERVLRGIAAQSVTMPAGARRRITLSGGVASAAEGSPDFDALVAAADGALLRAKREGRGRVRAAWVDGPEQGPTSA